MRVLSLISKRVPLLNHAAHCTFLPARDFSAYLCVCSQDGSEYYKLAQKFSKKFEAMYKKIDLSAGLHIRTLISETATHHTHVITDVTTHVHNTYIFRVKGMRVNQIGLY